MNTKPWFLSKTILLAAGLIAVNGLFLALTYRAPVYESAVSAIPVTPFSLLVLLGLNIAFDVLIIYTRKIATTVIE